LETVSARQPARQPEGCAAARSNAVVVESEGSSGHDYPGELSTVHEKRGERESAGAPILYGAGKTSARSDANTAALFNNQFHSGLRRNETSGLAKLSHLSPIWLCFIGASDQPTQTK